MTNILRAWRHLHRSATKSHDACARFRNHGVVRDRLPIGEVRERNCAITIVMSVLYLAESMHRLLFLDVLLARPRKSHYTIRKDTYFRIPQDGREKTVAPTCHAAQASVGVSRLEGQAIGRFISHVRAGSREAHLLDQLLPIGTDDSLLVDLLLFHERVAQVMLQHLDGQRS